MPRVITLAAALLMLAACGKGENTPGPGGVTEGEARALDDAAEMIEDRRLPEEAIRPAPGETSSVTDAKQPEGTE